MVPGGKCVCVCVCHCVTWYLGVGVCVCLSVTVSQIPRDMEGKEGVWAECLELFMYI